MTESGRPAGDAAMLPNILLGALLLAAVFMAAQASAYTAQYCHDYADKVVRLEYRYDGFTEEFSSILQRHARQRQAVQ